MRLKNHHSKGWTVPLRAMELLSIIVKREVGVNNKDDLNKWGCLYFFAIFHHFYKNQKSTVGKNGRKVKDLAFTFSSFNKIGI